jgi:Rnl2 family RNA ligase
MICHFILELAMDNLTRFNKLAMDNLTGFHKYNSIKLAKEKLIEFVLNNKVLNGLTYCVTEKAHGANLSFIYNDNLKTVNVAKRTSVLNETDNFFNWKNLLATHEYKIKDIFQLVKTLYPSAISIQVYGELIGGYYPNCPNIEEYSRVQKGVHYCPDHCFYAFDIRFTKDNVKWEYINYTIAIKMFEKCGMLYAEILFEGELIDALAFDPKFKSTIPSKLKLPEFGKEHGINIVEGIVIKPIESAIFGNGERVIFKIKNNEFMEKANSKYKNKKIIVDEEISDEIISILEEMLSMVILTRLDNVISKDFEPPLCNSKRICGRLSGFLVKDVLDEYNGNYSVCDNGASPYQKIKKKYQKLIKKKLAIESTKVVVQYFVEQ